MSPAFLRTLRLSVSCLGLSLLGACATSGTPVVTAANGTPIVSQSKELQLTAADYQALLAHQPREALLNYASGKDRMRDVALDLHSDEALAAEAEQLGLDEAPFVAARLAEARRKILSTARLLQVRDAVAVPADIETLMRERYARDRERLKTLEERKVAHILLTDLRGCPCEVKPLGVRVRELHKELVAGGDFAEAARKWSVDGGSAVNGGELPNPVRRDGKTVLAFEETAFALQEPGDISEPIMTNFGVHIIKLLGIEPARQLSYEEVQDQLRTQIINELRFSAMERARGEKYPDPTQVDYEALESAIRALANDAPSAASGEAPVPAAAPQPADEAAQPVATEQAPGA